MWGAATKQDSHRATEVCNTACGIRRFCLRAGLVGDEFGVWSGLAEKPLRELRRTLLLTLDGRPIDGSPELDAALDLHVPESRETVAPS